MSNQTKKPDTNQSKMGRRDLLKVAAASGAAVAVAGAATTAEAATGRRPRSNCTGLAANEAMPLSPLVLSPFTVAFANPFLAPATPVTAAEMTSGDVPHLPSPDVGKQDAHGGTHQCWPGNPNSPTTNVVGIENMAQPLYYRAVMRTGTHLYTTNPVRTLVPYRNTSGSQIPAGTVVPRLAPTTIYGFNGGFYGAMTIFAEYGKPLVFRIENRIDINARNLDRSDYGSPELGFLTHLHNGHTAAESDGNPHHNPHGYLPHEWVDNLYLNYAAGGDDTQKMNWLWFHDHFEGHTGANVYKGMAGLYPIFDAGRDEGNEANPATLQFPGVRIDRGAQHWGIDYDIPVVFHDVALDDGAVPHQDFHNGCGESQPHNFGKGYFRHFPNHGFVGDIFCINGTAYPTLTVKRRKYRFRFLGASISRQWEAVLMRSASNTPQPSIDLQAAGLIPAGQEELQGQYRLLDGVQCMRGTWIGIGGGLLPEAVVKDSVEFWPAMRPQVVYDFTQYQDGTPTRKGDVIWMCNTMKMPDGRKGVANMRVGLDPLYKVPMMKIVIGDDAPDASAAHWSPNFQGSRPSILPLTPFAAGEIESLPRRRMSLQRGGFGGEIEWLINGLPFDFNTPMFGMVQGSPEVWEMETGGGWEHPMHFHQEEFRILSRGTGLSGDHLGKDDVLEMRASERIELYRNMRSFTGKYVAHCHQLAHEDHAMMFGWVIQPPGSQRFGEVLPPGPVGTFR